MMESGTRMNSLATNPSSKDMCDDRLTHESGYTFFEMINTPLTTISILLNGFILLFIVGSPRLRKQHNVFTFNMALIDLTAAVFTLLHMFDCPRVSVHG